MPSTEHMKGKYGHNKYGHAVNKSDLNNRVLRTPPIQKKSY